MSKSSHFRQWTNFGSTSIKPPKTYLAPESATVRFTKLSIINSVIRFLIGNIAMGLFLWFTPEASNLFQEFGIDLSALTQAVIAMSERLLAFAIVLVPLFWMLLMVVEFGSLMIPDPALKFWANMFLWACLIITTLTIVYALGMPVLDIIYAL